MTTHGTIVCGAGCEPTRVEITERNSGPDDVSDWHTCPRCLGDAKPYWHDVVEVAGKVLAGKGLGLLIDLR